MSPAAAAPRVLRPLACPACRGELAAAELEGGAVCRHCRRRIDAVVFAPPWRPLAVPRVAESGPTAGAACPRHAGNLAAATCERCGVYCCALCRVDVEGRRLCTACFERLRAAEEPFLVTRYRSYRSAAQWLALFGFFGWPLGFLLGPLAIFFAVRAARQERRLEPGRGRLGIAAPIVLGLVDVAVFAWMVTVLFGAVA